ncbi:type I polyketide synthase [Streptomyces sioyaensis]|uniref:type I polyketide synthase n=1 Tax=Streptomyces sioyaensis TaxID=67364 RepID=UPI0037B2ADF5
MNDTATGLGLGLALVGMAGRFPGSPDIDALWRGLCAGTEGIRTLTEDELRAAGVEEEHLARPDYVRKGAVIEGEDLFDAEYFGYGAGEARIIDPQQRLFLECAAAAVQHAGYDTTRYGGRIGVFGSASANTYLLNNVWPNAELQRTFGRFTLLLGGEKDYLATRVAYKLHLTGPAVTVQTACSSSLVAVHLAAQSLVAGECDMALAGGVTVRVPQHVGHLPHESGIGSPDGACRAFDADGQGTLTGNGVGIVVLKRLEDALVDGDDIIAVLRGSAVTNDGSGKVGFTSPSVKGQSSAIRSALAVAEVDPGTIGYVEAHGTATPLGDPIEVAALTEAFGQGRAPQWCALGSVKTNLGHLDAAAGVTGLIKAALAVRHGLIPPSLHFERPNPHIDFASGPFFVNTRLRDWSLDGTRRAGVNSMGIGGTNAHVVLEQPPAPKPSSPGQEREFVLISARTPQALRDATDHLAEHLEAHPDLPLADVAWTTQVGRQVFAYRRAVSASSTVDAAAALRDGGAAPVACDARGPGPVWMFAGQGAQFPGMAAALHRENPAFQAAFEACADALGGDLGAALRAAVSGQDALGDEEARRTRVAQPLLFAVGYALAEALRASGLHPAAVIGHSIGEYVAAQQAGVFSLPDALRVVAARGRIVDALPPGAMLAVPLPAVELVPLLPPGVGVAAVNGPARTVASGPLEGIEELSGRLTAAGTSAHRLRVSHAFHSAAMDAGLASFREALRGVALRPPRIPVVSNVTGTALSADQATDPEYWVRHLRAPVLFGDGVTALLKDGHRVFLDVGAHPVLGGLVRHQSGDAAVVPTLSRDTGQGEAQLTEAVARLWALGSEVDLRRGRADEFRRRIPLPTYPFQRSRHWVDRPAPPACQGEAPRPAAETGAPPAGEQPMAGGRSATEEVLAAVWSQLLGVQDVAADQDFFVLGGHSLLATQVFARVHELLGVQLSMRDIFDHARLGAFADRVDALVRRQGGDRTDGPTAVTPGAPPSVPAASPTADSGAPSSSGTDDVVPLTRSQQNIWFLQQLAPDSTFYTLGNRVTLRGPLDLPALCAAVDAVVARHEILRTTFPLERRRPVLKAHEPPERTLRVVDLTQLSATEYDTARAAVEKETLAPVRELTWRFPFAATVVRRSAEHHELVLALHHIAADYWSTSLLLRQLLEDYEALAAGQAVSVDVPPVQYRDFALAQRHLEESEDFQRQLQRWEGIFRVPVPPLELPADGPRPSSLAHAGAWLPLTVPHEVGRRVADLARSASATPFMVLLAAFAAQLHSLSGQSDLCVGTYAGHRARSEWESLVGLFASTVPLRLAVAPELTFRELVEHSRATCLAAFDHPGVSVDHLLTRLDLPREPGRNPLFQAMLVLESAPRHELAATGLQIGTQALDTGTAKMDLVLVLHPDGAGFRGFLEYSADLFAPGTAERMATGFDEVLRRLSAEPDVPVRTLLGRR